MKDDLIIASKLLGDFNNFVDKRSTIFLTGLGGMLDSILQWHFGVWKKEHEYLVQDNKLDQDNKLEEWSMYGELLRTIDSIFRQIEIRALKERGSYSFFKKLESHVEKYKSESVSSYSYIESLFNTFYQVFFQNIHDAPDRFDIWVHYFPKKWKVTKSNLRSYEKFISEISLNNFFEWARRRIEQRSKEIDSILDDVTRNLFPEVDPILWARILIFIISGYGEDRLQSVIESPWNFGFMGRDRVYSGPQEADIRKEYEHEERNTFDLSYFLFKEQFSEINLKNYIKSLDQLSYPEEPEKERKKLVLLNLFTRMLNFVKDIEPSDFSSPH
jgi:hypothetical protein